MDAAWLRRAVALEPHLHKRSVPGDGDCQFHAVAAQSPGWTSFALRTAAVEFAARNPDFREFFLYGSGDTLDSWVARMRVAGAWGDNLSLYCLAHVLQRPVFIYKTTAPTQVLVPATLLPEPKPILVLLDESRPGAEHYSPLSETPARTRLRGKQKDLQPPRKPSSPPNQCLRQASRKTLREHRQVAHVEAGPRQLQRRQLPLKRPAHALKRPSSRVSELALRAKGLQLMAEGRSQKLAAMVLGIGRSYLRKLLRSAEALPHGSSSAPLRMVSTHASEDVLLAWIKSFWKRCAKLSDPFHVASLPPQGQGRHQKLSECVERLWMQTGSWIVCERCHQWSPKGLLIPHWPLKAQLVVACKHQSCAGAHPSRVSPHLAPTRPLWPPCFFELSDDDWDSLVLIRLKVDFKTIKAGRSPVVSKQKLEVVRGVWVATLPVATHLSEAAASALHFLLRTHAAYRCYWEGLQEVLDKSLARTLPTAEFLLRLPGVEVAMRPWLYPTDL